MSSWREQILKEFTPEIARLTLVADPDGLLLEEGILEAIHERGFELIPFEDRIAFRYAYETRFRSRWDLGEQTDLVVVLRSTAGDLETLPYDLLQVGRKLSFTLADLFPNLNSAVVATLDRGDFDTLYDAQKRHAPDVSGGNTTKEFILRHVFEITPETIKQPSELLRVLLRRHYRGLRIPAVLDERFIQILRQNGRFGDWPLSTLVSDREAFFAFLQERWPIFLDREAAKAAPDAGEGNKSYNLTIEGPADQPFDHQDIRVYIDNLFIEGFLEPVHHDHSDTLSKTWAGVGIRTTEAEDRARRLTRLIESLRTSIPNDEAKHTEWFHFAHGWAELAQLLNERTEDLAKEISKAVQGLYSRVDVNFTSWLFKRYAGLINLPPAPPVMLHHLPRYLSRRISDDPIAKIALIVIDGLAMDQWMTIRSTLSSRQPHLRFREQAIFAWIPSLTSVSRQAIFSGRTPNFFPQSIQTTEKEQALWLQFWTDQGLAPNEVIYMKGLGDGSLESLSEALSHPKARVAGLVIDKVDKIMHGMELGSAGMHNQVGQWAKQPYLSKLLDTLFDRGFRVYLTSDHGNIEAEGCGHPAEGAIADLRGERVRIYSDATLRGKIKEKFPATVEWGTVGLPEDYLPLLAPARQAFVGEKQRTVCHGGISIEELIVPLVQIEKGGE